MELLLFLSCLFSDDLEHRALSFSYNDENISSFLANDIKNYAIFAPLDASFSDSGRLRDEALLKRIYGANQKQVANNLTKVIWLKSSLNQTLLFNSKNGAATALQKVSDELDTLSKNRPQIIKRLSPSGTFNWRKIAKSNSLSAHSFGIAIDIDATNSSYWQWHKERKNLLDKEIIHIFEKNGFIWGGRWISFDTMHFEYRPEFLMLENLKQTCF